MCDLRDWAVASGASSETEERLSAAGAGGLAENGRQHMVQGLHEDDECGHGGPQPDGQLGFQQLQASLQALDVLSHKSDVGLGGDVARHRPVFDVWRYVDGSLLAEELECREQQAKPSHEHADDPFQLGVHQFLDFNHEVLDLLSGR